MRTRTRVWIDNGHGANTAGKHSPDFRLREWAWSREVAALVVEGLQDWGIDAALLTPEKHDVSLAERCQRVNRTCVERGVDKVVLVSIHNNASPPEDGRWHEASYWSVWVYRREVLDARGHILRTEMGSPDSQRLAELFSYAARENNWRVARGEYGDFKTANFKLLRETLCPAVLTENFFQDNRQDVEYLLSGEGKTALAQLHIQTIQRYLYDKGEYYG